VSANAGNTVTLVGPLPPPYGGISVHLLRLQGRLRDRGWRVRTLAAGRERPTEGDHDAYLGNSPLRHARGALRELEGVVHVHNRLSLHSSILCSCARRKGLPLVLTLHAEPRKMLSRRGGVDRFLAHSVRLADRVIAVNDHVADAVRDYAAPGKITVLPAYLPPSAADDQGLDAAAERWLAANDRPVATLAIYRVLPPVYGSRDIYGIDLVTRAVERMASTPFRLALLLSNEPAGGPERQYLDEHVARLRARLGDDLGVFSGVYAPPVLARSSVFLRPTLADGDSVAVREALDLGVPVLASDVVARPEGVHVHEAGDASGLAELWERLLRGELGSPQATGGPADRVAETIAAIYEELSSVAA
jgi:glycosyltransferase involved in cell wall biosynthesis